MYTVYLFLYHTYIAGTFWLLFFFFLQLLFCC